MVGDIEVGTKGARLHVCRSMTDQEGGGETVEVLATGTATCPVAALRTWLAMAGIIEGRSAGRARPRRAQRAQPTRRPGQ